MKIQQIITPEKDLENDTTLKGSHHLSTFQAELAYIIYDAAFKDFKDLKEMSAAQMKQFSRVISNYSWNITFAMNKLALDTRMSEKS